MNKRQIILAATVVFLTILILPFMVSFDSVFNQYELLLGLLVTATVFLVALLSYLQTGFRTKSLWTLGKTQHQRKFQDDEAQLITERLSSLENLVDELVRSTRRISDSQRTKLVQRLRKSIDEAATNEFLDELRTSMKNNESELEYKKELRALHEETTNRLRMELNSLTRRGNLNLAIGIVTAFVGIVILLFFISDFNVLNIHGSNYFEVIIPRISLVILVEVFAYFFLRLYSASLIDIKYFQNEITNVESKFLSLLAAAYAENEDTIADVISQLSHTERNQILQRGQTTIDLEHSKMENEAITSLIQKLIKTFSRRK